MNTDELNIVIKKLVEKYNVLYNNHLEQSNKVEELKFKIFNLEQDLDKERKEKNAFINKFNDEVDQFNELAENYNLLCRQYKILEADNEKFRRLYFAAKNKLNMNDIKFNEYNVVTYGNESGEIIEQNNDENQDKMSMDEFFI